MRSPAIEDSNTGAVSIQNVYDGPVRRHYVIIETVKQGKNEADLIVMPRYDLRVISSKFKKRNVSKYRSDDFDINIYRACVASKEGKEIINNLKNQETLRIVNAYTKSFDEEVSAPKGRPSKLKLFLKELLESPLSDERVENQLKSIKLVKEVVWKKFKEAGLTKKVQPFKTQNYAS
jgi:hypothetical protein